jgi:GNAT superfamily N-acetyltransferase
MRFLGGRAPRSEAELRHLVEVDHIWREAIVALDEAGRGVGIARYEAAPGSTAAEFAVVVDPAWRRVGLASALLTRLLRAALRNGITTIHVDYYAENRDVADLIRRSGGLVRTDLEGGIVDADVTIEPADATALETSRIGADPGGA